MNKKNSNLPDNVLPQNQIFDINSTVLNPDNLDTSWHPLHIEVDYMSSRELKRQEKLMARANRSNRRDTRREKNKNGNRGQSQSTKSPSHYAEKTNYKEAKSIFIQPRTEKQHEYLAALNNPDMHIIFGSGPAGTGKSYIATKWAMQQLKNGLVDKIVITRPNVAVDDNDLGYLPGDILEKLAPWIKPITDIMLEHFSKSELEYLIKEEIVEICPICFIRGRTFKNAIVIVDEAQGTTPNSMLAVLTRIGEGTKLLITGDIEQKDKQSDGLKDFIDRFKSSHIDGIALIEFQKEDVQRHPIISDILKLYNK